MRRRIPPGTWIVLGVTLPVPVAILTVLIFQTDWALLATLPLACVCGFLGAMKADRELQR